MAMVVVLFVVAGWRAAVDGEGGVSSVSQPPRLPEAGVVMRAARRLAATSLAVDAIGLWV